MVMKFETGKSDRAKVGLREKWLLFPRKIKFCGWNLHLICKLNEYANDHRVDAPTF